MTYLLDTCLLSEMWKAKPNPGVIEWLAEAFEDEMFLSVLSLGEIRSGIARLPESRRKKNLVRDYGAVRSRFGARVLPVTDAVAERWGELSAETSRVGRTVHVVDGLIAATAHVFGLTVVTRNVDDFGPTWVPVLDPWS